MMNLLREYVLLIRIFLYWDNTQQPRHLYYAGAKRAVMNGALLETACLVGKAAGGVHIKKIKRKL